MLGVREGRQCARAPYASYARCAKYACVMTRRLLVKAASQLPLAADALGKVEPMGGR